MFDRFSRSCTLVKASASVLKQDKELLLFPLISAAAALLVVACFALPMLGAGGLDGMTRDAEGHIPGATYVLAFLFYFSQYFLIFFFNTPPLRAALIRLHGGEPPFHDRMRVAT